MQAAPPAAAKQTYTPVAVHFATNRTIARRTAESVTFTGRPGPLHLGKAILTVPLSHEPGEIERPQWYRWQFRQDPAKHFTIQSSAVLARDAWANDLRATVTGSGRKAMLVFVHGYNVPFDDALYRTAQIKHDVMRDGGAALLLSWPSAAQTVLYCRDGVSAGASVRPIAAALRYAIAASGAEDVYLIAHSMGTRVLSAALVDLAANAPAATARIKEVILAAPDLDAAEFRRTIAPRMLAATRRTTIYGSTRDRALLSSRWVNNQWAAMNPLSSCRAGGRPDQAPATTRWAGLYRRLGDLNGVPPVVPPIELIDATTAGDDLLGHSYYGDSPPMLRDVRLMLRTRAGAAARGLRAIRTPDGPYWALP